MKYLPALLLMLITLPAWGGETRIDMERLQEQVKQRVDQAAQRGAAPSPAADWVSDSASPAQGHGFNLQGESGAQGQGYGQGYERRYGQDGEPSHATSNASSGGMGHGMGSGNRAGGRGAGQGRH